jgi:hypothetical protein
MRDREIIDSKLRVIRAVRQTVREYGGNPSNRHIDDLLDERSALPDPDARNPEGEA